MATNKILQVHGTQLLFADHAGDFGAAPATPNNSKILGTPTDVEMDLQNVLAAAGFQSAKTADLGSAWSLQYYVEACIEFETAPTAGGTVDFYWSSSPVVTAGQGNDGGATGLNASYTEGAGQEDQLTFVGSLPLINNVINIGGVGVFSPKHRFGQMIIINNGSTGLRNTATAMDETHITMTPIDTDIQASA